MGSMAAAVNIGVTGEQRLAEEMGYMAQRKHKERIKLKHM